MAVVELGAAERAAARATYAVDKQTTSEGASIGFRLPPERQRDLRDLFFQVESQMGMKSIWFAQAEHLAGARNAITTEEDPSVENPPERWPTTIKLVGAERWCNERRPWKHAARARARYARCRAALVALTPMHRQVIYRAYGPRDPFPFGEFPTEVAPIVAYTPLVETLRCETRDQLVKERVAMARDGAADADTETRARMREMAEHVDDLRIALGPWLEERARGAEIITAWRASRSEVKRLRKLAENPAEDAGPIEALLAAKEREVNELRELVMASAVTLAGLRRPAIGPGCLKRAESDLAGATASMCHLPDAGCAAVRHHAERLIRRGADAEVTRMSVMHAALHAPEGKDAESRNAAAAKRRDFIVRVTRQANEMLAKASVDFQLRWWEMGTPGAASPESGWFLRARRDLLRVTRTPDCVKRETFAMPIANGCVGFADLPALEKS